MSTSLTATRACPVALETTAQESARAASALWFSAGQVLLLLTLLGAPLAFGAVETWAWASLAVLVCVSLFLWTLGSVRQRVARIWWSPLYLVGMLFLLLGGAQYSGHLTLDPIRTRESLLKLAAYLLLFFVATQLVVSGGEESLVRFGFVVAAYACALGLFAMLQFCSSNGRIYWTVRPENAWPFGPYVNRNHYAGLMELLIPMVIGLLLSRPEHDPRRKFVAVAVLVAVASLLLSGSRGGLISFLVEALLLGGIFWTHSKREGRRSSATLLALGGAAAATLFFWLDPGEISTRLATAFEYSHAAEATNDTRLMLARDSLRMVRDHPWAGAGLGSFEDVHPRYQSFASDLVFTHAHNDYAEALAEAGLAGGALVLLALVIFLRRAFTDLRERLRYEAGWIQVGAAVGCSGLLVHSLADFNFHIPANAAWFSVCLAVALSSCCKRLSS